MSGSRPLADDVTRSTGTGTLFSAFSSLTSVLIRSISALLVGPRFDASEAAPPCPRRLFRQQKASRFQGPSQGVSLRFADLDRSSRQSRRARFPDARDRGSDLRAPDERARATRARGSGDRPCARIPGAPGSADMIGSNPMAVVATVRKRSRLPPHPSNGVRAPSPAAAGRLARRPSSVQGHGARARRGCGRGRPRAI